jgi:hypothetical protein
MMKSAESEGEREYSQIIPQTNGSVNQNDLMRWFFDVFSAISFVPTPERGYEWVIFQNPLVNPTSCVILRYSILSVMTIGLRQVQWLF